jgi:6-phosphofructokinase 1
MGCLAVDLLAEGKTKRVVSYANGKFRDYDINEALAMTKEIDPYQIEICSSLSHNYYKTEEAALDIDEEL